MRFDDFENVTVAAELICPISSHFSNLCLFKLHGIRYKIGECQNYNLASVMPVRCSPSQKKLRLVYQLAAEKKLTPASRRCQLYSTHYFTLKCTTAL